MERTFLPPAIVLLWTLWVMAQSAGTPSTYTTSPSSNQQPTAAAMAPAPQSSSANKHESFLEGCIGGPRGHLTLTDSAGRVYQLSGDTATLAEHVGQHATVTGIEEQGSASDADPVQPTFRVKKVALIARICPASK